ncbi:MAG: nucleotidyltransferase domain-containing protein [Promethearchaeota archaeon]
MRITGAIEGDYLETKENNLIFDVKGLLHPNDYIICFLRFFPHPNGERERNGINFKKIYGLGERYNLLRKKYPNYIIFSKELDLEVQGVKNDEIQKVYTPRNCFKDISKKNKLSNSERNSKDLCDLFITEGKISEKSIGITGSIMVNLNTEDSDIDIIIYGTETSLKFQEKLKEIFLKSSNFRKYTMDEYKSHYSWRVGGSDVSFKDFLKSEQRKQHQGKFLGRDFFIRYIKSPKDWKGNFYDYQYQNLGRIGLKAEILESKDSIFTPCSYKIKPKKILKIDFKQYKFKISQLSEINSFRGRFCEQAQKGETVLVEGKMEKVNFKNELEYFRILLNDPINDKMIII